MCVGVSLCACVCERERGEREIHPPSWMVRCLSLKPADEARVYAALGVSLVDVNISLYYSSTHRLIHEHRQRNRWRDSPLQTAGGCTALLTIPETI